MTEDDYATRQTFDHVTELEQENARLRSWIEAARQAYTAAVDAANAPRAAAGLWAPIGGDRQQWDEGYKNGVQACATVVWAALTPSRQ